MKFKHLKNKTTILMIQNILKGKVMSARQIHTIILETPSIIKRNRTRTRRNAPTHREVATLMPFVASRVNKGQYPALWTIIEEEE
jgi:hypothetical protein